MKHYQIDFLDLALQSNALSFGSFVLKSGRLSPYFFNTGLFNTGYLLSNLAASYATAIIESGIEFDILFGPAYKGIPLASAVVAKLWELGGDKYKDIGYSFNRKEKKDHGEGGSIVGCALKDKKCLIIDDAITSGMAVNEAFEIIAQENGVAVGCVIALDRQETVGGSTLTATQIVSSNHGVPVISISCFKDIVVHFHDEFSEQQRKEITKYRTTFTPASLI